MVRIGYLEKDEDISDTIDVDVYKQALDELIEEHPDDPFYRQLIERFEKNNL